MPQIREQIAMVHLPPSKTLKYLFHVRKTKISPPQGWLYFGCALPTRCLTVRPVALCPALWYTAHSYPHIAFIKEDCLCLLCWSAATGGST